MMNDLTVTLKIGGKKYKVNALEITTHKEPFTDELKVRFYRHELDLPFAAYRDVEIQGYRGYKNRYISSWLEEWSPHVNDHIITILFDGPRPWRKDKRRWTTQIYKKFFMTR